MRAKVLNEVPERTIALILDRGDEVMSQLLNFAQDHNLIASRLTAIGAFESATVGYFDWERKAYDRIPVQEQVERIETQGTRPCGPGAARRQHGGRASSRGTCASDIGGHDRRLAGVSAPSM